MRENYARRANFESVSDKLYDTVYSFVLLNCSLDKHYMTQY